MNQKTLEGLYKKGLITEQTYNNGIKKYADGGTVTDPALASQQTPDVAAAPQSLSPTVDPEIALAAQAAKENTIEQAQNIPGVAIERAPASDKNYDAYNRIVAELGPEAAEEAVSKGQLEQPPGFFQSKILEPLMKFRQENIAAREAKKAQILKEYGIIPKQEVAAKEPAPQNIPQEKEYNPMAGLMQARQNQASTMDKAFGMKSGALTQEAAAASKIAAAQASAYETGLTLIKDTQDKMANVEATRRAKLDKAEDDLKVSLEDFNKNSVIDPNRIWANKSTGDKVLAAIGIFLGGVGGGTNQALGYMQNAINRDIDAQKAQIANKRMGIDISQNVYKNMMDKFQDERAAEKATYLVGLQGVEMQMKKAELSNQNPLIKAKLASGLADIQMEKAKAQGQFMAAMQTSLPMMNATATAQKIMFNVPEDQRKDAYKELGEYQKHEKSLDNVKDAMNKIYENKNALPGSEGARIKKSSEALIQTYTSEVFGGKSESEFETIKHMFPNSLNENSKTLDIKMNQILNKFNSQVSFPILEEHKVIPKPIVGLKRNK